MVVFFDPGQMTARLSLEEPVSTPDGQGGATVGFSYRYYVHKDLRNDHEILTSLVSAHPFLKTKEPDVQVNQVDGVIHLIVRGEVYEYRSYPLEALGAVSIDMRL